MEHIIHQSDCCSLLHFLSAQTSHSKFLWQYFPHIHIPHRSNAFPFNRRMPKVIPIYYSTVFSFSIAFLLCRSCVFFFLPRIVAGIRGTNRCTVIISFIVELRCKCGVFQCEWEKEYFVTVEKQSIFTHTQYFCSGERTDNVCHTRRMIRSFQAIHSN